jgi:sulfate adenylyltransferase (ADP) / ATP adenylyltransferase
MDEKGTLWQTITCNTARALKSGVLMPIPSDYEFVEDGGIRFIVRMAPSLARKDDIREQQERESQATGGKADPFLPYEKDLFVTDISDTHIALLNKFNVVEHHLLIVTRHFEEQEMLLTVKDLEALWICMAENGGLGFYNGGRRAGASEEHKHLQLVPLPLIPGGPDVPINPLLEDVKIEGGVGIVPGFPFLNVFARLHRDLGQSPPDAAENNFEVYREMLQRLGMETPERERPKRQSKPYCLLITREWMLLVPRSREFFNSVSINSLGFAGALLVRNRDQLDKLKESGPMEALKRVTLPLYP